MTARLNARTRRLSANSIELSLLETFELRRNDVVVPLPFSSQRLVALLALHNRPLLRAHAASILWLDVPEHRAFANLRSALWRAHRVDHHLIETTSRELRLAPAARVDFRDMSALAHEIIEGSADWDGAALERQPLAAQLLVDWSDDWVLVERECARQLGIRALEVLADRLFEAGMFARALDAGLTAVAADPLRESAHRSVMRVHIAEGNWAEAIRQYHFCRNLLEERMGVTTSPQFDALVDELTVR